MLLKRLTPRIGSGADIAVTLVMAAAVVLAAVLNARTGPDWPAGVAAGLAICTTAVLRGTGRAWAAAAGLALFALTGVAVAAGAIPFGPMFGGGLAGVLVLGAAAMRTLPPGLAAVIGVAGTAVIAASETAGPGGFFDHRTLWALAAATLWSAALAVGLYLRYLDFLHRQALSAARREERLELARELHDVAAHHVTGVVVQAQAARFAGRDDPPALAATLASIETAGTETLAAIRQLVGLLRDPEDPLSVAPGPEPISQLVERFAEHGPAVDLRLPAGPASASWPPQLASTVYRVVQEALTNIARHAPDACAVTVTVTQARRQVRVEVADDAPAVPRHGRLSSGYGLAGMRERVEALGGRFQAGPRPGAGWVVQASLPVPARART